MFSAVIENRGDSRYFAASKDSGFVMDTEGGGANPIDTLLASLAACLGHMLRDFLRDHHISSSGFAIKAEAELIEDRSRLADIQVSVDLKDTKVGREMEADLMAYMERCKIRRTLASNSKIAIVLVGRP